MSHQAPDNSSSLTHFVANLPKKPYCSTDLSRLTIRTAKTALGYAYIQPNAPFNVFWLVFDLDLGADSFHRFEDKGTAPPNLIVQNPENLNCHYLFLLKTPVWVKNTGRQAPQAYLNAVRIAMTRQLSADPRYSGLICKNPLSGAWRASELHARPYSLDDLAKYLDLSQLSIDHDRAKAEKGLANAVINGRNDHLFSLLRLFAYERIGRYRELQAVLGGSKAFGMWQQAISHEAARINAEFPNGLPLNEVKSTAKSVSQWTWEHYRPSEKNNRGVLGFGQTRHDNENLPLLLPEQKRERQSVAAKYMHEQRKMETEAKIKAAIEQIKADGRRVTKSEVAKITELHRKGIERNYSYLFE